MLKYTTISALGGGAMASLITGNGRNSRRIHNKIKGDRMRKILLGLFLMLFSTPAFAAECAIKFGGGGKDSSWIKLKNNKVTKINNIGGPWSFIRKARGPCSFTVFNKNKFKGRRATYGTELARRIRTGAKGAHDKGGWKTRSVVITPNRTECSFIAIKADK